MSICKNKGDDDDDDKTAAAGGQGAVYGPYADSGAVTERRLEGADLSPNSPLSFLLLTFLCCLYSYLTPPLCPYLLLLLHTAASVLGSSVDVSPLGTVTYPPRHSGFSPSLSF